MDDRTERAVNAAYAAIFKVLDYSADVDEYARAAALAVLAEIDAECAAERDDLRAENARLTAECAVMEADRKRLRLQVAVLQSAQSGATWVCPDCDIAGCRHYRAALTTSQEGEG